MKKEKIIAVDIDEVLLHTIENMLKSRWYKYKWIPMKLEDITNYSRMSKIKKYNMTDKESIWFFARYLLFDHLFYPNTVIKWAFKKLSELQKHWYKFFCVTARHSTLWIPLMTKLIINKNFPWIFEKIFFCNWLSKNYTTKSEICKKIWAKIIIEDSLENCIDCTQKAWINAILFDKPRNQQYDKTKHKWITKIEKREEIDISLVEKLFNT